MLAAQKTHFCRKQLKGQETTGETSRSKTIKAEQETQRTSKKSTANKLTLESMPPQNSKRYQVFFGNDANFVNHPGAADIIIQPYLRNSSSTCGIFATSRLSHSASVRVHVDVRNGHGRARGVGAAPRRRRSDVAIRPRIPVPRIAYLGRDKKQLLTKSLKPNNDFIYSGVYVNKQNAWYSSGTFTNTDLDKKASTHK